MNHHYRRTPVRIFSSLLVIGWIGLSARAQTPAQVIVLPSADGSTTLTLPAGLELPPGLELPEAMAQPPSATNALDQSASPEEKRLKELLALSFDRGAPQVLSAMAERFEGHTSTNEVEAFQQDILVGDWESVGEFLAALPEDHGEQVYRHLLKALQRTAPTGKRPTSGSPGSPPVIVNRAPNRPGPAMQGGPTLVLSDILKLAEIAPHELTDEDARSLGQLLSRLLRRGDAIDPFMARLEMGVQGLGGDKPEDRRRAAELLIAAGQLGEAARFLLPVDTAKEEKNWEALEQHARELAWRGKRDKDSAALKRAWEINQFILTSSESAPTNRAPALTRCLELMPLLASEVGTDWLREEFRSDPGQGLAILGAVNRTVQSGMTSPATAARQKNLELQREVVDTFLSVADPAQPHWRVALNLLAQTWMQEASWSKDRYREQRSGINPIYDPYGNIISYQSYPRPTPSSGNQAQPIEPAQVLTSAPSEPWLARLDESLRLAVLKLLAELHLKTSTPEEALPALEAVAQVQPDEAARLANSLLRAWATAHDPTRQQSQRRVYPSGIYYPPNPYGSRSQGIALTRAMQVRNIADLSALVRRLKSLNLPDLSTAALVAAFSAAHSPAEVFKTQDIEAVFGALDRIDLGILAELAQTMRQRLARQWRSQRVQKDLKTKRNDKQIEAEVRGGYETTLAMLTEGLDREPDNWELHLARAATFFDLAEFQYGKKVDLEIYVEKRDEAFNDFEHAAELYAAALPEIPENEQTPRVYQQWFNANLGASDLAYVTRQQEPETNQLARIRAAILSLPGEAAERHMSSFAKGLGREARSLQPQLKPRYLRAGLKVVGDHADAEDARKLVTYYADLLREIELHVQLDGDQVVGHGRPFGVFVSLRHTADIEREAGGFARYLRDANKSSSYYYPSPSGQRQRNFVEDFDRQVREKLVDRVEVKSITFLDEKTQSRGYGREGWRETPLCYLLLRAEDGAVDQLPTFQMDLDFADNSGPVVLPVESQITLLDARPEDGGPRPVRDLEVTQILDDRDYSEGILSLEIKATGKGIVPELDELVRTNFAGFAVTEVEDLGITVTSIDTAGDEVAPVTERNWLFTLQADPGAPASLAFHFPPAADDETKTTFKRYADADLVEVDPEVALAGVPIRPRPLWHWLLAGGLVVGVVGGGVWWLRRRKPAEVAAAPVYVLPEDATPFALITLLRRMEGDESVRWSESNREELGQTIHNLERHFFSRDRDGEPEPNLRSIGERWVTLAGNHR